MVDVRIGWLLGLVAGASACFVPNPLFIATGGGSTGDLSETGASTTEGPASTGSSSATTGSSESSSASSTAATTAVGPLCGNGEIEPGEQCDDGNLIPGDDCETNCRWLFADYGKDVEGSKGATAIAVADLDGDGDDDLVLGFPSCANTLPCVKTWDNQGGVFSALAEFPLDEAPVRLFAADWNADGAPDVLAAHASAKASLLYQNAPPPALVYQFQGDLGAAVLARFNADGVPDLLVPDGQIPQFHMVPSSAMGGFSQPEVFATAWVPHRLATGTIGGEPAGDLLYTNAANPPGFALKLDFVGEDSVLFDTESAVAAGPLAVGDFAAEPWPNVAFADPAGNNLYIFNNNRDGTFLQVSYTVATHPGVSVLRSVRLNTPTIDNIVALPEDGLQIFTYDAKQSKVVAGKLFTFPGTPIDFVPGALGGDARIDIATLTTFGCYVMINQSGK